ncbi:MAG: AI-2E family transporter [Deltaproteobacteria bacterium]|nr:AI-2E family transporter [Deltaproteobacteria bacterium]
MSDPQTDHERNGPEETAAPGAGPEVPLPPHVHPEEPQALPTQFARLFFGAITLIVLYYSYEIIKPYLVDIFLALVLFFTAKPLHQALTRLLRGYKILASALTCLLLAIIIILPLLTLVTIIANQALEFSARLGQGLQGDQLWLWLQGKITKLHNYLQHLNLPVPPDQFKLEGVVKTVLNRASEIIYSSSMSIIKGFTYFVLNFILVILIAFFMFVQGDDFIAEVKKLSPLEASHNDEIFREVEVTIKATLWGTVVVAFIQGILGGVGFWLFGLPQPAFWGVVMVPAAVIPVVGAAVIWAPGCLYLFFQGAVAQGVGLLFFCLVVITSIDNLLKPILMRGSRSTPAIFILFSILGGIEYFGLVGFILGPLVLSFLLSFLRIYQKAILRQTAPPLPAPKKKPAPPAGGGPLNTPAA